ncbi:YibE/F family protein [Patescibacteria group bacterium]|nr:YibE/F family protein [Patescibacteria group bacterium]MBU1500669.1 YibE/F family protein [Patescibacteria group bacterium]MBU2080378.1 YibE/F family protein [Patescibacteria group bacterium]MBU2124210.1 YibE/F family protein [Patescibacteria group bacterium]MBU2194339.1 YibE/F family protein [Patescibacteria group bacterium]
MIRTLILPLMLGASLFAPQVGFAQVLERDIETLEKARVLSVVDQGIQQIPGTDVADRAQLLSAEVLTGEEKGKVVSFRNDFTQLEEGDLFYLRHLVSPTDGTEFYSVADPYRLNVLIGLAVVFVFLVFLFGGLQGMRGLLSLVGSLLLIFYVLLPGISSGLSPVFVAIGVASLIIIVGSYITHGFTRTTTAAVIGMISTVVVTGLAAWLVVDMAALSGYGSDESVYLRFQSGGTIDLIGVLLGGILIGLLGVLYDSAIGQAVAVEELLRIGGSVSKKEVYLRALRIGREHIGALVNTLAIAYVGASLPLFLLLQYSSASAGYIVNGEVFATEIVRILIGSIGLVLAVPVTTLIAVYLIRPTQNPRDTMQAHKH